RPFVLGTGEEGSPCDFVVPRELIGAERATILEVGGGIELVIVPSMRGFVESGGELTSLADLPAPIRLGPGSPAPIALGDLAITIECEPASEEPSAPTPIAWRRWFGLAASTLVHGIVLTACARACPTADRDEYGVSADDFYFIALTLDKIDKRAGDESAE